MKAARVLDIFTGRELTPLMREALEEDRKRIAEDRRAMREQELMRQIDCYVRAYEWAWIAALESEDK